MGLQNLQSTSFYQNLLALTVTIQTISKPSTIAVTVTVTLAFKTDLAGLSGLGFTFEWNGSNFWKIEVGILVRFHDLQNSSKRVTAPSVLIVEAVDLGVTSMNFTCCNLHRLDSLLSMFEFLGY